ncbi:MAG: fluoride efflux transporter CrcB [Planctomycetes bacterium]|nr:fluoride efflux transporter CrcB [Planctomycetota bacterium]
MIAWYWQALAVGCGGAIGALLRYGISELVAFAAGKGPPWGTLAVNLLGCLVIGVVWAWLDQREQDPTQLRLFLVTGLLGSLTTFSTFSQETVTLIQSDRPGWAAAYALGSLALGLCMVLLGRGLHTAVR